jgi:hypothetical protein
MPQQDDNSLDVIKKAVSATFHEFRENLKGFFFLSSTGLDKVVTTSIEKTEQAENIDDLILQLKSSITLFSEKAQEIEIEFQSWLEKVQGCAINSEDKSTTDNFIETKNFVEVASENPLEEDVLNEHQKVVVPQHLDHSVFINAQLLVSAGPRKEHGNDTELGEDACGIMNTSRGTYFWILDGTSDSLAIHDKKEHVFSSRVLAQNLSSSIKRTLSVPETNSQNLIHILDTSIALTRSRLLDKLKNAPEEIHQKISSGIQNNTYYFCSSTILFGFFSLGGELTYLILGDSEVKPYVASDNDLESLHIDLNENPSRLFFSINFENEELDIRTNRFKEKIVEKYIERADVIVAYSDGVKPLLPKISLSQLEDVPFQYQNTYDDKSMIILEKVNKETT